MKKPIFYVHKTEHQSKEEIDKKIQIFQKAGFRVVIISHGEEADLSSCLRKIIYRNISSYYLS